MDLALKEELHARREADRRAKEERGRRGGICQYRRLIWHLVVAVSLWWVPRTYQPISLA